MDAPTWRTPGCSLPRKRSAGRRRETQARRPRMRAPPWLGITALLCAGAYFAGRQSSGGGGAGPPQKQQPARTRPPPTASYTAEPLPSARTLPPFEAPSAEVAAQAPASAGPPPLVASAARSGAAAASAPEASAPDEVPEPLTSGCAMPFWRRDQFDAARDWTGMADAPSLAAADTWLRYDGTAAAGHLYSASTKGYVNLVRVRVSPNPNPEP